MRDKKPEYPPQYEDSEERELASHDARQAAMLGRMHIVMAISVGLVVIMVALITLGAL